MLADETLFHPDKYHLRHWMKSSEPILKVSKYSPPMPKINLCCVISESYGNVYNHYKEHYFSSEDMMQVL